MQDIDQIREKRQSEEKAARRKNVVLSAIIGLIVIVAFTIFALCVFGNEITDESIELAVEESEIEQASERPQRSAGDSVVMHDVVDSTGRVVTVPIEPMNVAIMDSFSGEYAIMIGAGDQVLGVPGGVKSDQILAMMYPPLTSSVQTTSGDAINAESLLADKCELAIVKFGMSEEETAKLNRLKIPYIVVAYSNFEEQLQAMELLGEVFGGVSEDRSIALTSEYHNLVVEAANLTSSIDPNDMPKVFHSINIPMQTDGAVSLGADWIARAGCIDISAVEAVGQTMNQQGDITATIEEVYKWNPDRIICNSSVATELFLSDAKYQELKAVKNNMVKTIPVGATRWGQRGSVETPLAIMWLISEVYPNLYSADDLKEDVFYIYKDILKVDITDELYAAIISGEGLRSAGNGDGSGSGGGGK